MTCILCGVAEVVPGSTNDKSIILRIQCIALFSSCLVSTILLLQIDKLNLYYVFTRECHTDRNVFIDYNSSDRCTKVTSTKQRQTSLIR